MLVREDVEIVKDSLDKLFNFARSDEDALKTVQGYISALSANSTSERDLNNFVTNYIFEGNIAGTEKHFIDAYTEKNNVSELEKEVYQCFKNSMSSVFKIKKVAKNNFEMYNLINEKTYQVSIIGKMVNFRGVLPEYYLIGRICNFQGKHYLLTIENVLPAQYKENALRIAVSKILQDTELLYQDNEAKLEEIQANINNIGSKYKQYFEQDEMITTTESVDLILSDFEDFVEGKSPETCKKLEGQIKRPEQFEYFDVNESVQGTPSLTEAAVGGFSAHKKVYDVGIMFDDKLGLIVLPFYGTFRKIFETENPSSIQGYKECILNYFNNNNIPPAPILKVYENNKEKFLKVVSEVLNIDNVIEVNDLLYQYKKNYFDKKIFSSPTVLYSSKSFDELMETAKDGAEQKADISGKVGRNEPCPCGSGKKYKKCCFK